MAGGELKIIQIPSDTGTVRLRLTLASDHYQSYRAEILTGERMSLLIKDHLQSETEAGGKFVSLVVPANILKRDDYQVKLSGQRPDGTYEANGGYRLRVLK